MLDVTAELCEFNDDPQELASIVATHRFEIVHLRKELAKARG
jgi:hypothetical protein